MDNIYLTRLGEPSWRSHDVLPAYKSLHCIFGVHLYKYTSIFLYKIQLTVQEGTDVTWRPQDVVSATEQTEQVFPPQVGSWKARSSLSHTTIRNRVGKTHRPSSYLFPRHADTLIFLPLFHFNNNYPLYIQIFKSFESLPSHPSPHPQKNDRLDPWNLKCKCKLFIQIVIDRTCFLGNTVARPWTWRWFTDMTIYQI